MEQARSLARRRRGLDVGAGLMRVPYRAAGRALALSLALCTAGGLGAQSLIQTPWPPGLDASFVERVLTEFTAQGFSRPGFVDLSQTPQKAPGWVVAQAAASPRAVLFAIVKGHGVAAECWVALRPQVLSGSPELMLARAGAASGASEAAMWRTMLRHELAHCAIARLVTVGGTPDSFLAEPFADIFALDWSERSEPGSAQLGDRFARARALASEGAHGTAPEIRRWLQSSRSGSPCRAAWTIAPLDARPPDKACVEAQRTR